MNPVRGAGGVQDIIALRQQIIDRSQLLQELRANETQKAAEPARAPADNFANALKGALDGVNQSQMNASALSEGYERGEVTDVARVMLARQEAGIAFEATLQVRNKLLSAYQDIMRMGV
jgi:flagellar hook-basal body complex protein FliE